MIHSDIKYFGESHIGRRANNEDAFFCKQINTDTYCFALADGMGGASYGEVASKIVMQDVELYLTKIFRENPARKDLKTILNDCFYYTQNRFTEYIAENAEHSGMGTTLVILLIHNQNYVFGNIGDSRLYGLMDGEIHQLTTDHTYIQNLIEKGIQIDSAINSNYSHLLTKCINGGIETPDIFPVETDFYTLEKPAGFILCSDGLILDKSENINDQKINEIFIKNNHLPDITRKLIDYAYSGDSSDNITVIVVKAGDWARNRKNRSKLPLTLIITGIFILLFTGLYLKREWMFDQKAINLQSKHIVPAKPIHKTNWQPLDTTDVIPKSPSSYIVWNAYPDITRLKEYHVILLDSAKKVIQKIKVKKKTEFIKMGAFTEIKFSGKYFIGIEAVLKDESIIIGNVIKVQTNNTK
jgi:serine/threonine protein phosphatase PrpC